jgi:hypothetical protein
MRDHLLVATLAASALLAGCSGGGGGSPITIPSGGSGGSPSTGGGSSNAQSDSAISDANAFGSPLKDYSDFDKASGASSGVGTAARVRVASATGACNDGVEFYAPDKNGDPNSTETLDFYDSACTIEASDLVRLYTSTGASSETVAVTESFFAPLDTTPIATRSSSHAITNATFNKYGYPIAADGYDLVETGNLNLLGTKTIASGSEFALQSASSGTNAFCSDSSGYNATGFAKLGVTFGWQGGVLSGGTRTVNADNSVTWTATHAGTVFKGPIGGLSIAQGTQNTSCPISTPMFTLAGGTAVGTYSLPVTATFVHGMLESLTITNATLSDGDTLTVTTNASEPPQSAEFITGVVTSGTTQIATFAVNSFGDGTLTITKTGAQYVITDWHVVR